MPRPKPPGNQEVTALKKAEAEEGPPAPPRIEIELEGIADRVMEFPVPEARYGRVDGIKGKALFSTYPIEGSRGRSRMEEDRPARGVIESYDLENPKQERLVHGISDFSIGRDGKALLYQSGHRLRVLKAGRQAPEKEDDKT